MAEDNDNDNVKSPNDIRGLNAKDLIILRNLRGGAGGDNKERFALMRIEIAQIQDQNSLIIRRLQVIRNDQIEAQQDHDAKPKDDDKKTSKSFKFGTKAKAATAGLLSALITAFFFRKQIMALAEKIWSFVWPIIKTKAGELGEWIWKNIIEAKDQFLDFASDQASAIWHSFLFSAKLLAKDFWGAILKNQIELAAWARGAWAAIRLGLPQFAVTVWKSMIAAVEWIKTTATAVWTWIGNLKLFGGFIQKISTGIWNAVTFAPKKILEIGKIIWGGVLNSIGAVVSIPAKMALALWNGMVLAFSSLTDIPVKIGALLWNSFLATPLNAIKGMTTKIATKVWNAVIVAPGKAIVGLATKVSTQIWDTVILGTKALKLDKIAEFFWKKILSVGVAVKATGTFGKVLLKQGLRSLIKKIPLIGAAAGIFFAIRKLQQGDLIGAGLELVSGLLGIFPGVGTVLSALVDAGIVARELGAAEGTFLAIPKKEEVILKEAKEIQDAQRKFLAGEDDPLALPGTAPKLEPRHRQALAREQARISQVFGGTAATAAADGSSGVNSVSDVAEQAKTGPSESTEAERLKAIQQAQSAGIGLIEIPTPVPAPVAQAEQKQHSTSLVTTDQNAFTAQILFANMIT